MEEQHFVCRLSGAVNFDPDDLLNICDCLFTFYWEWHELNEMCNKCKHLNVYESLT